jgi:hypothetical protein
MAERHSLAEGRMMPARVTATPDRELLERLNALSLTRSFTPEIDLDWSMETTDAEFESLYRCWSLLEGTGLDRGLDAERRTTFAKYQQANLMAFTGLLERHGVTALARLYDLADTAAFSEYVGHFIKEEIYHHTLFLRAVSRIHATLAGRPALPLRGIDGTMRWLFRLLGVLPGRKLRVSMTFILFRFAEQVTIYANRMVEKTIPRRESLIRQIWSYHAMDETRHLAFDALILERSRLPRPFTRLPVLLAVPFALLLSFILNANEVWIARQVGVPVRIWQLPSLMRRTTAPFKRDVFGLLGRTIRGRETPAA